MIRKQDILSRAAEWQLRPEVVEKDYVLGWLLAGLARCSFGQHWIFKGGTCIKKCFAETYRFSEDLDFSLVPDAAYTEQGILDNLKEMARIVADLSGLDLPLNDIAVRTRQNRQGHTTFEGRIPFQGPLRVPGYPRVRFDLTRHEPVLDDPDLRSIFHPYPDTFPDVSNVLTYGFNEILAEKLRALYERARPRDLYDVVFLLRNQPDGFDLRHVLDLFSRKCGSKGLTVPTVQRLVQLVNESAEMRSEWENMLGHQLPTLPDLDATLAEMPGLLAWLETPAVALPSLSLGYAPISPDLEAIRTPAIQYWGATAPLEVARFAGANRLLVEFDYGGKHRVAEPYSLRRAATGNLLLYAWEEDATHIKAFNAARIMNLRATSRSFTPRYRVEFTAAGPLAAPPARQPFAASTPGPRRRRQASSGPTYVFECGICGKKFRRKKNDSRLNAHKSKDGWPCPGRVGYLVDTRY